AGRGNPAGPLPPGRGGAFARQVVYQDGKGFAGRSRQPTAGRLALGAVSLDNDTRAVGFALFARLDFDHMQSDLRNRARRAIALLAYFQLAAAAKREHRVRRAAQDRAAALLRPALARVVREQHRAAEGMP